MYRVIGEEPTLCISHNTARFTSDERRTFMPDQKPDTVRLTIDGTTVAVPKGTLVIEAARRVGVMIPHFCYHPKLKPDANCRMCLVEIEKDAETADGV